MKCKIENQLKIGTILSYISIFISLGSGLILTPFIIKSLTISEYGLYSLVGSLVGYLSILEGGIGTTVVRYVSKYRHDKSEEDISNLVAICKIIYMLISIFIL
ncbi:MAG: lipopolysaccharide biosynthesis protein, partial [Peptostreptococcaceae bacterium]